MNAEHQSVAEAADLLLQELGFERAETKLQWDFRYCTGRDLARVKAALGHIRRRRGGDL